MLAAFPAFCEGRLDAFESGFSKSESQPSSRSSAQRSSSDSGGSRYGSSRSGDDWIINIFGGGGASSVQVARNRPDGYPVVPVVRSEVGWMWVDSHVQAVDVGLEAGYAFLALEGRWTEFMEEDPGESLGYGHLHVLYRMALMDLEIGVGLGPSWLKGDRTRTSMAATLPVRYWPSERWGIEIRPVWTGFDGVGLRDIDTSLLYRREYWTVSLGYRWIESDADVEGLSGIRAGIGFRY
jgi:hypothetical protein